MSGIVQLEGVNKYFGKNHVVKNLNLSVEEGEFLTLLGSSGCGKTTTLRMIAGFEEPTSGSILVEGQAVEEKEPFERNVNTVFQSYALFPHKTIYDNVAYGLKMKKVPKTEIARRVKEIMALVQLTGFEERYPSQLSGGQKQRVAIARALINRPRVLLLDEPLGALDLKLRKQMQLELKRLQRKLNITFIYVTHDQEEALTMSDRIAVMHDGILDQLGTPEEIYEQPRTKFVATFIGETNIFEGNIKELAMGRVAVRIENGVIRGCGYGFSRNEYITVSVRPEKMKFSAAPVKGFQLEAQVKDYVYAGSVVKCIAVLQNGMEIKMDRLAGEELPEPGSIIHPWWEEKDAVLLHNPENQVLKMIDSMPLI
ncbi:MAG TPA: ABC transporter ATP-binding protein [Candidatus Eisenbergiella stercorigallinarum]|uniref:Spermidine/putrescine import ATP-binding protein PotA n=1 Tax=Candidatus Eisenbergiella stercorigallinarum TaxID=2838557 RepID=A0A9D2QZG7_9FIRM|nr:MULTISPECIES: ABC transporter ATP-binding protein [unclassified Lachnoclostridium]OUQ16164.1 spermidine/putrescine ABC transporter ATP-binding protein [Lachnoclostridium sp. An138]OUQ25311.1 spermidine/putrescine ABC transporter ATP-binding protein [Lachnoclostridium sp. An131]HJD32580.1 ABC transporter ATP-binding protein [Candidatus Eisenbergiella stercorigallinarum]